MTLSHQNFLSPYRMFDAPAAEDDASRQGALLVTSDGRALPLLSSRLVAEANGGIARVVLEQTFENRHEETLRVTYKMPLPPDGAVSGYEFQVGLRTIKGHVEPKEKARENFELAIAEGRTAALLEQQRANIFTQEIGNVPAKTSIVARITIDQRLTWLAEGEWELRFPTVIGPRYIGSVDTEEDLSAVRIAVTEKIGSTIHFELRVRDEITKGRTVESPSHRLEASGEGTFTLAAKEGARLDRDIVARWSVAQPDVGISIATARPNGNAAHATCAYGLLTIVPPAPEARFATMPRDLIILLDTSGSMGGQPLEQAKKAIAMLIDSLGDADRIELVEFSSRPNAWRKTPEPATRQIKKLAKGWLMDRRAGGATEMHTAVLEAMNALRPGSQRQVVLVTDGYIGGEQQIVNLLHERLPASCRLHVIGVGSAVNRSLALSLSRVGRGAEAIIGLDEDVERPVKRLLDRTAAPVLTDLVVTGDAVVEHAPEHMPDVFAGAPVLAAVKLSAEGGEVIVKGTLANGTWERRVRVPAMNKGAGNHAIVALYGREHVADLEMRWQSGKEMELIDRKIEGVGVVFQIATRKTSWVAIDDRVSVDPTKGPRHEVQPQEIPYGTTMASFGLASGVMAGGGGDGFVVPAAAAMPMMPGPAQSFGQFSSPEMLRMTTLVSPAKHSPKKSRRSPWVAILLVLLFLLALAFVIYLIAR